MTPSTATPAIRRRCSIATTEAKLLLMGNWADPSILKDGDDYYLTHSSFEFQPGWLVWHSKNLRSWQPLSRAVTNQPGSIWAPELIKHDGTFYRSDSFDGPQLGIQWQFLQQYDAKRLASRDLAA